MELCSILIPCFNEEATVYELLRRVTAQSLAELGLATEVIVVDDGSTDGSRAEIERFLADHPGAPVRLIASPANQGKGDAVRVALSAANGDIVLIQDADLEYDPADYPAIIKPIVLGLAPVVYGSRWIAPRLPITGTLFAIGAWLETRFLHTLYRTNVSDVATCYKAFRSDVLRDLPLTCKGFEFCPEVTALLLNRRVTILEVPIRYTPRTPKEGKKIRWPDFFIAVSTLLRVRLGRR